MEEINSPGAIEKFIGESKAKNFRSWINTRIGIATKNNNLEVQKMLQHILQVYNKYHPEEREEVSPLL